MNVFPHRLTVRRLMGLAVVLLLAGGALAQDAGDSILPTGIQVRLDPASSPKDVSQSIRIMLLITALSLAPSFLIMTTSFTRILIVLGVVRQAMGFQNIPPGQILTGIALFLTMFTMMPVWEKINEDAIKPYMAETISQEEAWERGIKPLKTFMLRQTGDSELNLFFELSSKRKTKSAADIPLHILIPAFMISELKIALEMAFLVYLPFLVVDLVVASSLMSLGMMMLPPMMISLPVKILLFVLADGWTLLLRGLVTSFSI